MSTEMLSTGIPEVFENESSFVSRKLSLEMSLRQLVLTPYYTQ